MADNLRPLTADAERARREIVCRPRRPRGTLRLRELGMYPYAQAFSRIEGADEEEPT